MKLTWLGASFTSLLVACGARTGLGAPEDELAPGDAILPADAGAEDGVVAIEEDVDVPPEDSASPFDARALDEGASESEPGDATGFELLCPDRAPTGGDVCVRAPYYCYYFASPTAACSDSFKCLHFGPGPEEPGPTNYGGPWPACDPGGDATGCAEGKACGLVEPKGGCFVACSHKCGCNAATGTLRCEPLAC